MVVVSVEEEKEEGVGDEGHIGECHTTDGRSPVRRRSPRRRALRTPVDTGEDVWDTECEEWESGEGDGERKRHNERERDRQKEKGRERRR